MIRLRGIVIGVVAVAFFCIGNSVLAIEPLPEESGFGGFVQPGVGYLSIKSNMVAEVYSFDLSEDKIDSVDDSPDSETTAVASLPFELNYTFAGSRTQVFLGTQLIDLLRFDFSQQLGVRQELGGLGVVQAGVIYSGVASKVWKDPYVEGEKRKDTSRSSTGGRLVWDRILGSGFQLQYTYRSIDLGSEKSGRFLGLNSSDRGRLDREGSSHSGTLLYRFKLGERHRLTPEFILGYDDRDGEARKNVSYGGQLTYSYLGDPVTLILNGYYSYADYDKKNPIFDKTQEDDVYGVGATAYYKNPWGWRVFGSQPLNFFVSGAYYTNDSNIDFYEEELAMGSAGVLLRW
jgi:hypothetical protein